MELVQLQKRILDFQNGLIFDDNKSFVSISVIEEFFKRKYEEFYNKSSEFVQYLGQKLEVTIENFVIGEELKICGYEKSYKLQSFNEKFMHSIYINYSDGTVKWYIDGYLVDDESMNSIKDDEIIQDYIKYAKAFQDEYSIFFLRLACNLGLFVDICFNSKGTFATTLSDEESMIYCYQMPSPFDGNSIASDYISKVAKEKDVYNGYGKRNFFYFKDILKDEKKVYFDKPEAETFLDEKLLDILYSFLKIDISKFPEKTQEEIRQLAMARNTKLKEQEQDDLNSLRKLQVDRITRAAALIKEATELLNNVRADLKMDRIKIDNIEKVIFKNNGLPNSLGCIEFEDFFKNNMILRMLDLSSIDLTNVDIRGIDFSGTNIHIDPQTIYNKDMSYVNATDVKFSPFSDCFDDVVLNGTIITDMEANIDLGLVQSYNSDTIIKKEVIDVWGRF